MRNDDEGSLIDLVGAGCVLDQLDDLVLEDDSARCGCDVVAHFESRLVGHRDPALGEVLGEQLEALGQALATSLQRQLLGLRVGHQVVRRAQRVGDLTQREAPLPLAAFVERGRVQCLGQQIHLRQIRARDRFESWVLGPGLAGEPAILDRLGGQSHPEHRRPLRGELIPAVHLPLRERGQRVRPLLGGGNLRAVSGGGEQGFLRVDQIGEPTCRVWRGPGHGIDSKAGAEAGAWPGPD